MEQSANRPKTEPKPKMTKEQVLAKAQAGARKAGTIFKPGQSGNPSGRPKSYGEAVRIMRELALDPKNVEKIKKLLNSKNEQIRLRTLEFIHTRAFGAPAQAVLMRLLGDQDMPAFPVDGETPEGAAPGAEGTMPPTFNFNPDDPVQQKRAVEVGKLLLALGTKIAAGESVDVEFKHTNGSTKS
jgi:Family of unknown function (DUF5681)